MSTPSISPTPTPTTKLWMPERVLFTDAAIAEPWGKQICALLEALNLPIEN